MARRTERTFGQVIRERRGQLNLTQQEVAGRIGISSPYIWLLEVGKRHPSDKMLHRLAQVLGLDPGELFLLANPRAVDYLRPKETLTKQSASEEFRKDTRFHRLHNISDEELDLLSRVALTGELKLPRDFLYILNTVRHALGR